MADIFTKAKRSHVMSLIRSRGNKDTEVVLARMLRANGITGWRRHVEIRKAESGKARKRKPAGEGGKAKTGEPKRIFKVRPDFVFKKQRLAVFVDGCFWHGCPIHGTKPKGNRAFWRKKFATNIARDERVNRALRSAKWRVLRIWEHELKHEGRLLRRIRGKAEGGKAGKRKRGGA